jgi:hypothetical protein
MIYVIRSMENNVMLFWSNADGWGDIASCDLFSAKETEALNLPVGGQWVHLNEAMRAIVDEFLMAHGGGISMKGVTAAYIMQWASDEELKYTYRLADEIQDLL